MKKVVGIVPSARLFENEDLYQDQYSFVNNYSLRVAKNGGTPIGLLSEDGYLFEDALELADSILICGGRRIFPYHFQAVQHAVEHKKPLLGICLGMQVIHAWFTVADEAERRNFRGSLLELYEIMKKERYMFVLPVEHHWDVHMVRGHEEDAKHPVQLSAESYLSRQMETDVVWGATMHNYRINQPSDRLKITGRTADGTIEMIEYADHVIGVQFHPEVDDKLDPLFRFLTAERTGE